jgi:hypothetical protein
MNALLIQIVLLVLLLFNLRAQDITIRVEKKELDKDSDGKMETVVERTYRGNELIMYCMKNTINNKQTRIFYVNKLPRVIESDEDGDGFFETRLIYGENTTVFDVFILDKNGGITPIPGDKLKRFKNDTNEGEKIIENTIQKLIK